MKTLITDAIIGAGFPTLTLAVTAEQAGLAHYSSIDSKHIWLRDKLEELDIPALKTVYEGLRAERESQEIQAAAAEAASHTPVSLVIPLHAGVH